MEGQGKVEQRRHDGGFAPGHTWASKKHTHGLSERTIHQRVGGVGEAHLNKKHLRQHRACQRESQPQPGRRRYAFCDGSPAVKIRRSPFQGCKTCDGKVLPPPPPALGPGKLRGVGRTRWHNGGTVEGLLRLRGLPVGRQARFARPKVSQLHDRRPKARRSADPTVFPNLLLRPGTREVAQWRHDGRFAPGHNLASKKHTHKLPQRTMHQHQKGVRGSAE